MKIIEGLPKTKAPTNNAAATPTKPLPSRGAKDPDLSTPAHLLALKERCFSSKIGKYKYEVCPFQNVTQLDTDARWNPFYGILGIWDGWKDGSEYTVGRYTDGTMCGTKARTVEVHYLCGEEVEATVSDVKEPETCTYTAEMRAPEICNNGSVEVETVVETVAETAAETETEVPVATETETAVGENDEEEVEVGVGVKDEGEVSNGDSVIGGSETKDVSGEGEGQKGEGQKGGSRKEDEVKEKKKEQELEEEQEEEQEKEEEQEEEEQEENNVMPSTAPPKNNVNRDVVATPEVMKTTEKDSTPSSDKTMEDLKRENQHLREELAKISRAAADVAELISREENKATVETSNQKSTKLSNEEIVDMEKDQSKIDHKIIVTPPESLKRPDAIPPLATAAEEQVVSEDKPREESASVIFENDKDEVLPRSIKTDEKPKKKKKKRKKKKRKRKKKKKKAPPTPTSTNN